MNNVLVLIQRLVVLGITMNPQVDDKDRLASPAAPRAGGGRGTTSNHPHHPPFSWCDVVSKTRIVLRWKENSRRFLDYHSFVPRKFMSFSENKILEDWGTTTTQLEITIATKIGQEPIIFEDWYVWCADGGISIGIEVFISYFIPLLSNLHLSGPILWQWS